MVNPAPTEEENILIESDETCDDKECESCGCDLPADYAHACCPACGSDQDHCDEDDD